MTQTQAPHNGSFIKLLTNTKPRFDEFIPHTIKGCELGTISFHENVNFFQLVTQCRPRMQADCPHTSGFVYRAPKLLWNPSHSAAYKWHTRHAIRKPLDSFCLERFQCIAIKSMSGSNPQTWFEPFTTQDFDSSAQSGALCFNRKPSKLYFTMHWD